MHVANQATTKCNNGSTKFMRKVPIYVVILKQVARSERLAGLAAEEGAIFVVLMWKT